MRPAGGRLWTGFAGTHQAVVAALALLCALLPSGCAPEPAEQTVLEPVLRFVDEFSAISPQRRLPQGRCRLGDEIRPALGCLSDSAIILPGEVRGPDAGEVEVRVRVNPDLALRSFLVRATLVEKRKDGLEDGIEETIGVTRGPALATPTVRKAWAHAPLAEDWQPALISAFPLPPSHQLRVSAPTKIAAGSRFVFSTGYDPDGRAAGAQPATMRLSLRRLSSVAGKPPEQEIFRTTVDPETNTQAWQDHSVALDAFAGETVRFVFESDIAGDRGGDLRFTLPLWGAPRLLAPRPRGKGRNLVLISLDTLRADQLGGSLDDRAIMPELDRWAAAGVRFGEATATYPSTTGSHMSLLTGLYPIAHRTVAADQGLPPMIPTLAELLAIDGWATAAVTEDAMLNARSGFSRGFDDYREFSGSSKWESAGMARQGVDAALGWLEKHADERFFLFLHTYQVHSPYLPPKEFDVFSRSELEVPEGVDPASWRASAEEDRRRYSGEALYLDSLIKKLMDGLVRLGLDPSTIVVVTSDHGEEFEEHGGRGHSAALYQESVHVPLVVRAPGLIPSGRVVASPVSLVDVVPTLLDLLGVRLPAFIHGVSLEPVLVRGESVPDHTVFSENQPSPPFSFDHLLAARQGNSKWIFRSRDDQKTVEIYDLNADPAEKTSLDDRTLQYKGEMIAGGYMKLGIKAPQPAAAPAQLVEPETQKKLRALGYVE